MTKLSTGLLTGEDICAASLVQQHKQAKQNEELTEEEDIRVQA